MGELIGLLARIFDQKRHVSLPSCQSRRRRRRRRLRRRCRRRRRTRPAPSTPPSAPIPATSASKCSKAANTPTAFSVSEIHALSLDLTATISSIIKDREIDRSQRNKSSPIQRARPPLRQRRRRGLLPASALRATRRRTASQGCAATTPAGASRDRPSVRSSLFCHLQTSVWTQSGL